MRPNRLVRTLQQRAARIGQERRRGRYRGSEEGRAPGRSGPPPRGVGSDAGKAPRRSTARRSIPAIPPAVRAPCPVRTRSRLTVDGRSSDDAAEGESGSARDRVAGGSRCAARVCAARARQHLPADRAGEFAAVGQGAARCASEGARRAKGGTGGRRAAEGIRRNRQEGRMRSKTGCTTRRRR